MDPTGKFAYVVNEGSVTAGSISIYTIDPMTGVLTPRPLSPELKDLGVSNVRLIWSHG